ncbi:MAG: DNA mismatch repair endonuclease MutL [Flavobacteriaceae bacterium]|jgi:DNA mismatch repair protein MutL|nr:DNA mismatch repair endonuclease MutL [Flavobacteriaceae bacterium]MBT3919502.1 DNA mismatch repair endonuclease MutL [Flavobacteriaceae bacterium]MBT6704586.1 DNA mismatch repair endonuclease MutL [Flavobacteriaceae bacterium]
MADIIQLLPDHVANQIAAGEVIQRPASLVKELLENAIDAKATSVNLLIKDAGKTLVQVIDNGIGMSITDARFCFERHATSKIKAAEDLFNINTKGFRGEALASIAAIAHVELKTKRELDEVGTHIIIEGSSLRSQDAAVVPIGTSISVKNLFYNIPARRNFLKSYTVETRHIIDEFHRVALAHSQVAFSFINNGSTVFNLPASNIRQRIVNIFGTKTNEKLVPVSEETEIVSLEGFVVKPEFAKKGRGEQFFFVNNRFIKSPYLHHAIISAFEGLIKEGGQPGYFLFLEVNTQSIDINIHPTKTEIKFDDEHAIYAMLRASVKHSLGQFSIVPVLDFNKDPEMVTPYDFNTKNPIAPTIEVDRNFNPFEKEQSRRNDYASFKESSTSQLNSWEAMYVGLKSDENSLDLESIEFESEEVTGSFFESEEKTPSDITFQLQNKYIMSPIKSGIMVIHQNLAHQRVLYESILKNITVKEAISQQLLFPLRLNFTSQDIEILKNIQEQLEHTGFGFSAFEEDIIEINGIPIVVKESEIKNVLESLVNDIQTDIPDVGFSQNDLLAKSLAKSLAIKTGKPMNVLEQEYLVHQLFACKEPTKSPTNKPVLMILDASDIDKKFN